MGFAALERRFLLGWRGRLFAQAGGALDRPRAAGGRGAGGGRAGLGPCGSAEPFQAEIATAFELSGDTEFLLRAAQMLGGGDLLGTLEARGLDGIETTAALLALAQEPSQ